nr:hypothetical protein [Tanacetum cinerariifolium]
MQLSELMEICKKKKKKRTHGIKRLYKVGLTTRVESSEEEKGLGDQKNASKLGRIAEIDADEDLSLINETTQDQGRMNDEDYDEVIEDVTAGENVEQDETVAEKEVSDVADEVVTTAESVKGITTATTLKISKDDVTLAQTLIEIKTAKPMAIEVIVQEPKVARKLDAQMKAEMEEEERIAREKDEANMAVIKE